MQEKKSHTRLLAVNADAMNRRARQFAHSRDRQPSISFLQTEREKGQTKRDECGTLQEIARPSLSSSGSIGYSQVSSARISKSFAVRAASENLNYFWKKSCLMSRRKRG